MALAAASLWKQVLGAQATLLNEEPKVFLQSREQKVLTQVFRAGWISDFADPFSFLELFRTGHGRNDFGFSNELYDSLLDEIASERVPARRRRLMFEAERMLLTEMPYIPVYSYVTKRLVSPRLRGWDSNIMDHHYSKNMFLLKAADEGGQSTALETENIAKPTSQEQTEEIPLEQSRLEEIPEEQPVTEPDGELATETGVDADTSIGANEAHAEPSASQADLPELEPEKSDQDTIVPVEAAEEDDASEDGWQVEEPPE